MLQPQSLVTITDNSGGKVGRIFKVLGGSKKRYAEIGELVVLSIQKAEPRKQIKKKDVVIGVVVRQKKAFRRKDGSYIRFDEKWGTKRFQVWHQR
jgi:large subunit ribosomal protein L14